MFNKSNNRYRSIKEMKKSLKTNPPIKGLAKPFVRIYERYEEDILVCRSINPKVMNEQSLQ